MSQGGRLACGSSCTSCGRGGTRGAATRRDDSEYAAGVWMELEEREDTQDINAVFCMNMNRARNHASIL